MQSDLKNNTCKTAIVTGGTSGIGFAIVSRLLRKGYFVVAIGKNSVHALEAKTSLEAEFATDRFTILHGDLLEQRTLDAVGSSLSMKSDSLDLLVNSAGTISLGGIEIETENMWDDVIATNLTAMFRVTKRTLPWLRKSKFPNIVNISSVCSLRPCTSLSYSVSKAGVDMFTKVLAKELAQYRIRVNAVNPGVVRSNLQISANVIATGEGYENWMRKMSDLHPLGRTGVPDDVAAAVEFLSSDDAAWITGAILSVDGGRSVA